MSQKPVYVSRPHKLSLGQEYRIYEDRLELKTKVLFRTLKIPLASIIEISVQPKPQWRDMFAKPLQNWWTFNNDRAAFHPHVYLRRKGWPPRIRFVPNDPAAFVAKCHELMQRP